jgi:alkylhydroperoxidase/carboxymuconolactone decarboxylase family protein YurZ
MSDADAEPMGASNPLLEHYDGTLGNIPPAIRAMSELDDGFFDAYTTIRKLIYQEREDGLPLAIKELLLVVLDITVDQGKGGANHLAAAKRAGLTKTQLKEALMEVFMVLGVSAWGKSGFPLWDQFDEL